MKGSDSARKLSLIGLLALLGGAAGISFAPLFVRLSDTGPTATAFYRILIAQPFLWVFVLSRFRTSGSKPLPASKWYIWFFIAGLMFALDMGFWHLSIHKTTLANSTLIANAAPIFVIIGARLFFGERIPKVYSLILVLAGVGVYLLVRANISLGSEHMVGDLFALVTAFFYGAYQLCVKYLRNNRFEPAVILAYSGISAFLTLGIGAFAMGEQIWITNSKTAWALIGLALVSHIGGQGLIVYAFGHLPAGLASLGLLLQPIMVIILGWVVFDEPMDWVQLTGACILLSSLYLATVRPPSERIANE